MLESLVHQLAQVGLQLRSSKTKIFTIQSLIKPFFVSLCGGVWRYGGSTHGRSDTQISFFVTPRPFRAISARSLCTCELRPLSLILFEDENTSSHLYPVPLFFLPNLYGTAGGAAAAQRAGRQLGTGGHASCRTSCRGGACAPGIGAWTGGDPSKVAASVFCTATLSRPHQRLYQPWVAAPRSGAGARRARERTSCATRRSDSSFQRPPISHASTHSRCGPRRRSSG